MKEVVTLLRKRGFNFQWLTRSASSMGAPHMRNRWFCLAIRDGCAFPEHLEEQVFVEEPHDWSKEPCPRSTFKPITGRQDTSWDEAWIQRCQCLGNSVVPCVVRTAFKDLVSSSRHWPSLKSALAPFSSPCDTLEYPFEDAGLVLGDKYYPFPSKPANSNTPKHSVPITIKLGEKITSMPHFPTPRRGICHASTLTERSMRDLPTVLINSQENLNWLKKEKVLKEKEPVKVQSIVQANVEYIEWMMGYPRNWTRVSNGTYVARQRSMCNQTGQGKDDDDFEQNSDDSDLQSPSKVSSLKKPTKRRLNGMHVFMRENPGKDIRQISAMWNALSDERKKEYSEQARNTP